MQRAAWCADDRRHAKRAELFADRVGERGNVRERDRDDGEMDRLGPAELDDLARWDVAAEMMYAPIVLAQGGDRHLGGQRVTIAGYRRDNCAATAAAAGVGSDLAEDPADDCRRPVLGPDRHIAGLPLRSDPAHARRHNVVEQ